MSWSCTLPKGSVAQAWPPNERLLLQAVVYGERVEGECFQRGGDENHVEVLGTGEIGVVSEFTMPEPEPDDTLWHDEGLVHGIDRSAALISKGGKLQLEISRPLEGLEYDLCSKAAQGLRDALTAELEKSAGESPEDTVQRLCRECGREKR